MSVFMKKVHQIEGDVLTAIKLCKDIRVNRRMNEAPFHLDQLQSSFEGAKDAIPKQYEAIRMALGPDFDSGDDKAKSEMVDHLLDMRSDILPHLKQISLDRKLRHPRFGPLLQRWNDIYKGISKTMYNLSRRIEETIHTKSEAPSAKNTPTPAALPAVPSPPSPPFTPQPQSEYRLTKVNPDEVVVTKTELEYLFNHMKNCWEEVMIDGLVQYVNIFDPRRQRWDAPEDAFIKRAPRTTSKPSQNSPAACGPRVHFRAEEDVVHDRYGLDGHYNPINDYVYVGP